MYVAILICVVLITLWANTAFAICSILPWSEFPFDFSALYYMFSFDKLCGCLPLAAPSWTVNLSLAWALFVRPLLLAWQQYLMLCLSRSLHLSTNGSRSMRSFWSWRCLLQMVAFSVGFLLTWCAQRLAAVGSYLSKSRFTHGPYRHVLLNC